MSVIAKFRVNAIRRAITTRSKEVGIGQPDGSIKKIWESEKVEVQTIEMTPVYDSDKNSENGQFWEATPNGKIELGTINAEAGNYFELDRDLYVIFSYEKPE